MNTELMKNRRKELGMTQQDLADKCGLSRVSISNYESGKAEPTFENIEKIALVLGLSDIDLIFDNKPVESNDDNFLIMIELMQESLINFIEIIISKNLKSQPLPNREIAKSIIEMINSFSAFTPLYSEVIERIIFVNLADKSFYMCYIETFENYILNLISLYQNISKNKLVSNLSNDFLFSIFEKEYKHLEIKEMVKEYENNNEFLKAYLKEFKQNKEGGSDE